MPFTGKIMSVIMYLLLVNWRKHAERCSHSDYDMKSTLLFTWQVGISCQLHGIFVSRKNEGRFLSCQSSKYNLQLCLALFL